MSRPSRTLAPLAATALALLAGCGTTDLPGAGAASDRVLAQGKTTGVEYQVAEAFGTSAWAGGTSAWAGGTSAWAGGTSAWAGGDPTVQVTANLALYDQIKLPEAHGKAPNLGAGVVVAVVDTGVDLAHPALAGRLADPSTWYDFVSNDEDPREVGSWQSAKSPYFGHGTAVAGVVAQVAPNARIMPLRALSGSGKGDTDGVAAAIRWAVAKGANVINLSLGTTHFDCAIQKVIANEVPAHVVVVASSGNRGDTSIVFPAATSAQSPNSVYQDTANQQLVENCGLKPEESARVNLVTVGVGSVSTDSRDQKSGFSTYGQNLEMLAPGEGVHSSVPDGGMAAVSGTSFAAPQVSGALALAMAEKATTNPGHAINSTNDSVAAVNPDIHGGWLGSGRLNAQAFLAKILGN